MDGTILDVVLRLPPLLPVTTTITAIATYHHHHHHPCRRVLSRVGGEGFPKRLLSFTGFLRA